MKYTTTKAPISAKIQALMNQYSKDNAYTKTLHCVHQPKSFPSSAPILEFARKFKRTNEQKDRLTDKRKKPISLGGAGPTKIYFHIFFCLISRLWCLMCKAVRIIEEQTLGFPGAVCL